METFLYLVLIVLLSSFVAGAMLVIMVKKYYWGPTGLPPKQRYKLKESKDETENRPQSASNEKQKK